MCRRAEVYGGFRATGKIPSPASDEAHRSDIDGIDDPSSTNSRSGNSGGVLQVGDDEGRESPIGVWLRLHAMGAWMWIAFLYGVLTSACDMSKSYTSEL